MDTLSEKDVFTIPSGNARMMTDPNRKKPAMKGWLAHNEAKCASYQFRWMQELVPGFLEKLEPCRLHSTHMQG